VLDRPIKPGEVAPDVKSLRSSPTNKYLCRGKEVITMAAETKEVEVVFLGSTKTMKVALRPGATVADLKRELGLNSTFNLSLERGGEVLSNDVDIYSRVRPGEQIYMAPSAPQGA
jgi:hypothetical protein